MTQLPQSLKWPRSGVTCGSAECSDPVPDRVGAGVASGAAASEPKRSSRLAVVEAVALLARMWLSRPSAICLSSTRLIPLAKR